MKLSRFYLMFFAVLLFVPLVAFGSEYDRCHDILREDALRDINIINNENDIDTSYINIINDIISGEESDKTNALLNIRVPGLDLGGGYSRENFRKQFNQKYRSTTYTYKDKSKSFLYSGRVNQGTIDAWKECMLSFKKDLTCVATPNPHSNTIIVTFNWPAEVAWAYGDLENISFSYSGVKFNQQLPANERYQNIGNYQYDMELQDQTQGGHFMIRGSAKGAKGGKNFDCKVDLPPMKMKTPPPPSPKKLSEILKDVRNKWISSPVFGYRITGMIAGAMLEAAGADKIDEGGSCGVWWYENHDSNKHPGADKMTVIAGGNTKTLDLGGYHKFEKHHMLIGCFEPAGLVCVRNDNGENSGPGNHFLGFEAKIEYRRLGSSVPIESDGSDSESVSYTHLTLPTSDLV